MTVNTARLPLLIESAKKEKEYEDKCKNRKNLEKTSKEEQKDELYNLCTPQSL